MELHTKSRMAMGRSPRAARGLWCGASCVCASGAGVVAAPCVFASIGACVSGADCGGR